MRNLLKHPIWFFPALLLISVGIFEYGFARSKEKSSARIIYSGNLQGEVSPCGCKHNMGGLIWWGGFIDAFHTDSIASLTVEMGNFSPKADDHTAPARQLAFKQFFSKKNYDAIGLSQAETQIGLSPWTDMSSEGYPIVVANLFSDPKFKKPIFDTHIIKKDHGVRFAVIGFLSKKSYNFLADKTGLYMMSPFEMEKFVKKVAKSADHVTLIGDFSKEEADSLAKTYPYVDMILASGILNDEPVKSGDVLIMGAHPKGRTGDYVEWNIGSKDEPSTFETKRETIDNQFDGDTVAVSLVKSAGF